MPVVNPILECIYIACSHAVVLTSLEQVVIALLQVRLMTQNRLGTSCSKKTNAGCWQQIATSLSPSTCYKLFQQD